MNFVQTHKLTIASLCLCLSGSASAFQMNGFSIFSDGAEVFLDTFDEDGIPTTMVNIPGSTTTESGGYLNFATDTVGFPLGDTPFGPLVLDEVVVDNPLSLPQTSAGLNVTGVFDSDFSLLTANPTNSFNGFGITISGTDAQGNIIGGELGIYNNFDIPGTNLLPGGQTPTPTIFFSNFATGLTNAYQRLDPSVITGDIFLNIYVATDGTLFPSYSLDGVNYVLYGFGDWQSENDPLFGYAPIFTTFGSSDDVVASAFGQVAVPIPPTFALIAAPLGMLLTRRKISA